MSHINQWTDNEINIYFRDFSHVIFFLLTFQVFWSAQGEIQAQLGIEIDLIPCVECICTRGLFAIIFDQNPLNFAPPK